MYYSLRSLEVHGSDSAGEFNKDKKRDYKFYYDRPGDGKYMHSADCRQKGNDCVQSAQDEWVIVLVCLQKHIGHHKEQQSNLL